MRKTGETALNKPGQETRKELKNKKAKPKKTQKQKA